MGCRDGTWEDICVKGRRWVEGTGPRVGRC